MKVRYYINKKMEVCCYSLHLTCLGLNANKIVCVGEYERMLKVTDVHEIIKKKAQIITSLKYLVIRLYLSPSYKLSSFKLF